MRRLLIILAVAALCATFANAAVVTLGFDTLQCYEFVGSYYAGGTGSLGSGPGPNDGITFSSNAETIPDYFHPGSCSSGNSGTNTGNMPSDPNGLFFLSGSAATMDVPAGFTTGFSFYYNAENVPGSITVWSGLDGTGTELASLTLPTTGGCGTTPTFCVWDPIGVTFSGTAESVNFAGTENQIVFDNITLGASSPGGSSTTPEPATFGMIGLGISAMALVARRRKATQR
jgi:hypothetical protein